MDELESIAILHGQEKGCCTSNGDKKLVISQHAEEERGSSELLPVGLSLFSKSPWPAVNSSDGKMDEDEDEDFGDNDCDRLESVRRKIMKDVGYSSGRGDENDDDDGGSLSSPFGHRVPLVYCDHTATGRPSKSIERYIQRVVYPRLGNVHTDVSVVGSQSTAFVAEARQVVAESFGGSITGKGSRDLVLFRGSGTTGAVRLLLDCLGLSTSTSSSGGGGYPQRPLVLVGPWEHHSNLVPWRETGAEIVMVPESSSASMFGGGVDLEFLEKRLVECRNQERDHHQRVSSSSSSSSSSERVVVGTFSAASNVTGRVCDEMGQIARILHRHGALLVVDAATAAPYLNRSRWGAASSSAVAENDKWEYDALVLSPHKCTGGTNAPGVLVVKKHLVDPLSPPPESGGGTVFYVTKDHHRFLSDRTERHVGGSPDVVGICRVGLSLLWKRKMEEALVAGPSGHHHRRRRAEDLEFELHRRLVAELDQRAGPNLVLLHRCRPSPSMEEIEPAPCHLPILSFLVRCGPRFLHFHFVCALLNDLFGIQTRGGCMCAGPTAQRMLGLEGTEANGRVEETLLANKEHEVLRPGFTRLSLPYKGGTDQHLVRYVVDALCFVCRHGWTFLHQYRCHYRTGEWRHHLRQGAPLGDGRRWLGHYDPCHDTTIIGSEKKVDIHVNNNDDDDPVHVRCAAYASALERAERLREEALVDRSNLNQALNQSLVSLSDHDLRWYVLPQETARYIVHGSGQPPPLSDMVLGALRPLALCGRPTTTRTSIAVQDSEPSRIVASSNDELYSFRDGEYHIGQATRTELEEGHDDGELSESCVVYVPSPKDAWVPIHDFLRTPATTSTLTRHPTNDDVTPIPALTADVDNVNVPPSSISTSTIPMTKAQRKKPSRDSSTWGKVTTPPPVALCRLPPPVSKTIPSTPIMTTKVTAAATATTTTTTTSTTTKTTTKTTITTTTPKEPRTGRSRGATLRPPAKLLRSINQAMLQFEMIREGDRLLLGLSGGKDSLTLLQCLLEFRRRIPINFDIQVCTVDPMTPSFDPSPLIPYVRDTLGLTYHYVRDNIVDRARVSGGKETVVSSLCAFCARMKRGILYTTARANGCNVLVLGQHLDDCAESLFMSFMHNGALRTMAAHYTVNEGDLRVIRPLLFCREATLADYARQAGLPVIHENCPACFEEPKERDRVKKLLAREAALYPNLYDNLRRAMLPLFHEDSTSVLRSYTELIVGKTRKKPNGPKKPYLNFQRKAPMTTTPTTTTTPSHVTTNGEEEKKSTCGADTEEDGTEDAYSLSEENPSSSVVSLSDATEEQLVVELARRRAQKYRLHGAMKLKKGLGQTNKQNHDHNAYDDESEDINAGLCTGTSCHI